MPRLTTILLVLILCWTAQARWSFAQGILDSQIGLGGGQGNVGQGSSLGPPQSQGSSGFGFGGPSIADGLGSNQGPMAGPTAPSSLLGNLDITFIEGDKIVARIGDDIILLSEVYPLLNLLHRNPAQINEQTLAEVRAAVEANLPKLISVRLVIQDFERSMPNKEARTGARKQFIEHFEEEMIPNIMEQAKVSTRAELVEKLRENGLSLDQIRKTQVDSMLMSVWIREKTSPSNKEYTREELLEYYNNHLKEFDFPSRARWEQISVAKKGRSRDEALSEIYMLGNAVVLRGIPFAQVARDRSDGPTASAGGVYGWTQQGSLVSEPLDAAIFSVPVGQMSRVIEDERNFHIIRVIEREMAGRKPFEEVQDKLRLALKQEESNQNFTEYMAKLRETIPVASILDGTLQLQGQQGPPAAATVGDGYAPRRN